MLQLHRGMNSSLYFKEENMKTKNYPLYEPTVFADFRVMVEDAAKKYQDRPAISFKVDPRQPEVTTVTYADAQHDIRNFGTALVELGCREQRCAIIGACSCGWVYSYFTLMAIGAITVPLDREWPVADWATAINKAECSFVFYSDDVAKKITELKTLCSESIRFICINGNPLDNDLKIDDLISDGGKAYENGNNTYYDYEIDPDRLASIVFTSGTTGKGKGVMLSQTNIVTDITQGSYNFTITPKTLCALPPHHTFGSTINLTGHYALGSEIYISSGIKYIQNELKEQKPSHLILVPLFIEKFYKKIWLTAKKNGKEKMLRRMMKLSNGARKVGVDIRKVAFSSILEMFGGKLEFIICGGAALNQEIIDTFEAIGITILNGYGITECAPLISCNRNKWQKTGSVGVPIIGELVKIKDPDENGEGEICVKGSNVMLGYYKDSEATKAAFDEEGYFRTGDLGRLDEDGWVYITGRIKNLIILSNGKNVYPEELETEISGIEGVGEVVVYAGESLSDQEKEVIVAEIFPDDEVMKLIGVENPQEYFSEKIKAINERVASYKKIGLVKIRTTEFVKNTSKKITRFNIDKSID